MSETNNNSQTEVQSASLATDSVPAERTAPEQVPELRLGGRQRASHHVPARSIVTPLVTRILQKGGLVDKETAENKLLQWAAHVAATGGVPTPEDRRAAEKLSARMTPKQADAPTAPVKQTETAAAPTGAVAQQLLSDLTGGVKPDEQPAAASEDGRSDRKARRDAARNGTTK